MNMKNFNPEDYVGKTYYYHDGSKLKIVKAQINQVFKCLMVNSIYCYMPFDDFQEQIEYKELLTKEQLDELKEKEEEEERKKRNLTENLIHYLKVKEDAEKNISEILQQLKEY